MLVQIKLYWAACVNFDLTVCVFVYINVQCWESYFQNAVYYILLVIFILKYYIML